MSNMLSISSVELSRIKSQKMNLLLLKSTEIHNISGLAGSNIPPYKCHDFETVMKHIAQK